MKIMNVLMMLSLIFILVSCSDNPSEPSSYSPTITITSPTDGLVLNNGDMLTVNVEADDDDGSINQVILYLNDVLVESDGTLPYQFTIETDTMSYGNHTVKVIAEDNEGNESFDSISIDIYKPIGFDITYGSENITIGISVLELDDGYVALGSVFNGIDTDICLIKTDLYGNVLWNKIYAKTDDLGDGKADKGNKVIRTLDGGFMIVGQSGYEAWTIKTDSDGNIIWDKLYISGLYWGFEAIDIQQINTDKYVILCVAGFSDVFFVDMYDDGHYILYKILSDYHGVANFEKTSDGGYIIGFGDKLVKTSDGGSMIWEIESVYCGGGVKQTSDGGYIVLSNFEVNNIYIRKYNNDGMLLWSKILNGRFGYSLQIIDDGCIICGVRDRDGVLIKTDGDGNEVFNRLYGGIEYDGFEDVKLTSDGGYIMTGINNSRGIDSGLWLVKTDKFGDIN